MAFPRAQRGHDAERAHRGQAEARPRRGRIPGDEARQVDAGGDGRHALHRHARLGGELAAHRLAGGDDVRVAALVEPARPRIGMHARGDVARAHDRGRALERAACERTQPAIGGAVRVEDVDAPRALAQPAAQRAEIARALLAQVERRHRHAHAPRGRRDRRLGRGEQGHVVAAIEEAARFGEDAHLLAAPAEGVLRVHDGEGARAHAQTPSASEAAFASAPVSMPCKASRSPPSAITTR